jgi:ATP-dependent protease Clp ATPase subunit
MKSEILCSFCRKPASQVAKMVGDPKAKVFICDECIKVCYTVVSEDDDRAK